MKRFFFLMVDAKKMEEFVEQLLKLIRKKGYSCCIGKVLTGSDHGPHHNIYRERDYDTISKEKNVTMKMIYTHVENIDKGTSYFVLYFRRYLLYHYYPTG